jgi:hypothetical protein
MTCNKRRVNLLIISLAAFLASLTPAAYADNCSNATVAGSWGLTLTGTLLLPSGPVSGAAVATLNADPAGNVTGTEARNVGGGFANETIVGSWSVNGNCTGTITANIYESGVLVRTSVLSLVFDENSTEIRMLQQSLTIPPNGVTIPVVITVQGKKMFPQSEQ